MPPISPEAIAHLKQTCDLPALLRAEGIALKRRGRNLAGRCPYHEDDTPSLILSHKEGIWLYHCFGCGIGGDVFQWVMKRRNITFPEAYEWLTKNLELKIKNSELKPDEKNTLQKREISVSEGIPSQKRKTSAPASISTQSQEIRQSQQISEEERGLLLNKITEIYHKTMLSEGAAQAYLKRRGIYSEEMIKKFRLGFSNRTLGYHLPASATKAGKEIRGKLLSIGVLYGDKKYELFLSSLVVPLFDEHGNTVGMYGRKAMENYRTKTAAHLYLAGERRGIFNREAFKSETIILCEALIDALTFWVHGFHNVTSSYGVEGFSEEHLKACLTHKVKTVYIAYDRDESGEKGAWNLAQKVLIPNGIKCFHVKFPRGMDANEYALKMPEPGKALQSALEAAEWMDTNNEESGRADWNEDGSILSTAYYEEKTSSIDPIEEESRLLNRAAEPLKELLPAGKEQTIISTEIPQEKENLLSPLAAKEAAKRKKETHISIENQPQIQNLSFSLAVETNEGLSDNNKSAPAAKEKKETAISIENQPILRQAQDKQTEDSSVSPLAAEAPIEEITGGIRIKFGNRAYHIYGMDKNLSYGSLQVSIRVEYLELSYGDQINFWVSSQKDRFIKKASREFNLDPEILKRDVGRIFRALENLQREKIEDFLGDKIKDNGKPVALSPREIEEASAYLKDPELLKNIIRDFKRCGLVGEEINSLIGYLAALSRKFKKPLAIIIQSSSSAGKSTLMEKILSFFPPEVRIKFTTMTGQSLYYIKGNLKHKILAISEEEGIDRAKYALKILQSEEKLTIAYPVKNPKTGKIETEEHEVEGPVMIITTTTNIEIDEELENRCILLTINESREQTRAIQEMQRLKGTLEGLEMELEKESVIKLHQNVQRLLMDIEVVNPYSKYMSFLDSKLRTRRDHEKYLSIIFAIAFLHQQQREHGKLKKNGKPYIEVSLEDIEAANHLCNETLGKTLDDLTPQTQRFLDEIEKMVKERCAREGLLQRECIFLQKDIRQYTGYSDFQVKKHLKRLVELEYILAHKGKRGSQNHYELLYQGEGKDGNPFVLGLLNVEELRKKLNHPR